MAEPFVFHFRRGAGGAPESMYMVDLWCACTLCGYPQIQRFYPSTSLHALSWAKLCALVEQAPALASYECEQCGTLCDRGAVERWQLVWGAADDAGEVVAWADASGQRRWQLRPGRRLDPQHQPRPELDPALGVILERCEEEDVAEALGRPFMVKAVARDVMAEALETGCAWARVGEGGWLFGARDEASARELAQEALQDDPALALALETGWSGVLGGAGALVTHRDPARMPGRWALWASARAQRAMAAGELCVMGVYAPQVAARIMSRAFEVGRITASGELTRGEQVWLETPHKERYPAPLEVEQVCWRALHTGLTLGEAARLTAEEIVGTLLGVWRS
jgi:hypothetical protein